MRVLIVARCKNGRYAPFISEQVEAVQKLGVECKYYGIIRKGVAGYVRQFPGLVRAIRAFRPDLVHAHYGLCGLLANFQRRVPVVTTYHGSDINDPRVFRLSRLCLRWSRFNIFVSRKTMEMACPERNYALIPCGVNLEDYPIVDRFEARNRFGLDKDKKYVLFAGAFDNFVKNAPLAQAALSHIPGVELLELKGYSRFQVAFLMQAVDVLLMTSLTEGSPQVIKEAMACGCPIVSVDVGDVRERMGDLDGCFIAERDPEALAAKVSEALAFGGKTEGRNRILAAGLTNDIIAERLVAVYRGIIDR